jgi:enoyl-CoA hydratase
VGYVSATPQVIVDDVDAEGQPMTSLTSYQTNGRVATVVMDDGKANVLSFDMFDELNATLDRAQADEQVVVLAGRPGRFSGGFDLAVLTAFTDESARLLRAGFELAHRMLSFPRPIVVAVTGHAYAMGGFLVLSGDYRLGAAGAEHRITANEVAIGLTLPRAALEVCRQRLTRSHFERATALAEIFDPGGAVEAGWLDEVVPETDLLDAAQRKATALAALDAKAHTDTKLRSREAMLAALWAAIEQDDEDFRTAIASVGS